MRIFGIVGWKNSGKTGLMVRLITEITSRGFGVSTLKHAHHSFDVDQPGKDSYRHREAGAGEVMLASAKRWALMHEVTGDEPALNALLPHLSPVDLVLVEGFKSGTHPKIEAYRSVNCQTPIATNDRTVLALAADCPLDLDRPLFDLDDTVAIADFILRETGLTDA